MNSLDEVPFQTLLGSLEEPLRERVTAPDIIVPDCLQILRDTQYEFTLENWALTGLQYEARRGTQPAPPSRTVPPSCPPYWLTFNSPQQSRAASRMTSDLWEPDPRPRSYSLTSADAHRLHPLHPRPAMAFNSDAEDAAGYSENDAGYSEDDEGGVSEERAWGPSRGRERLRGAASKDPLSRVKELHHLGPSAHYSLARQSAASPGERGRAPPSMPEQPWPASPLRHRRRRGRKRQKSLGSAGRNTSLASQASYPAPPPRPPQARPSSAGPARAHRQQTRRTASSHGLFCDSSAELLSALSEEEREILEAITDQGCLLRTAIWALQKTGYRSPEKILSYLAASERLCESGYDEAQVEEALEMFQNCESKAVEFLCLLTQFSEMGFQQSEIKEVLLVHENHRERALEELMTRMA